MEIQASHLAKCNRVSTLMHGHSEVWIAIKEEDR